MQPYFTHIILKVMYKYHTIQQYSSTKEYSTQMDWYCRTVTWQKQVYLQKHTALNMSMYQDINSILNY